MNKTRLIQFTFPLIFLVAMGIFLSVQHAHAAPAIAADQTASTVAPALPSVDHYFNNLVTPDMLTAAGFTNVTIQPPLAVNHFAPPVYYFHVAETVSSSFGWGSSANVVAVVVRPKLTADWQYNGGQMETRTLYGRTQIRFTTAKNYIVVTGPDAEKTTALANDLGLLF